MQKAEENTVVFYMLQSQMVQYLAAVLYKYIHPKYSYDLSNPMMNSSSSWPRRETATPRICQLGLKLQALNKWVQICIVMS